MGFNAAILRRRRRLGGGSGLSISAPSAVLFADGDQPIYLADWQSHNLLAESDDLSGWTSSLNISAGGTPPAPYTTFTRFTAAGTAPATTTGQAYSPGITLPAANTDYAFELVFKTVDADYAYIYAFGFGSIGRMWIDLSTGATSNVSGALALRSFHHDVDTGVYKAVLNVRVGTNLSGNLLFGISDAAGSETVTAEKACDVTGAVIRYASADPTYSETTGTADTPVASYGAFALTDAQYDSGADSYNATVTITAGNLTVSPSFETGGQNALTYSPGDGDADATFTATGATLDDLNAALNKLAVDGLSSQTANVTVSWSHPASGRTASKTISVTSRTSPAISLSSFDDATDTASYTISGTEPLTIYWVLDESATPPSVLQVIAGNGQDDAAANASGSQSGLTAGANNFSADVSGVVSGNYYLYSVVSDGTFNSTVDSEGPIAIDNTVPNVSTLSPADGATDVAIDANLVMTFDESMSRQGTVTLKNVGGATIETFDLSVDGTWSTVSNTDDRWTGNPASDFVNEASLAVQWSGLEDTSGNALTDNATDTTWNFDVVAAATGPEYLGYGTSTANPGVSRTYNIPASTSGNTVVVFVFYGSTATFTSLTVNGLTPTERGTESVQGGVAMRVFDVVIDTSSAFDCVLVTGTAFNRAAVVVYDTGTQTFSSRQTYTGNNPTTSNSISVTSSETASASLMSVAVTNTGSGNYSAGTNMDTIDVVSQALDASFIFGAAHADSIVGGASTTYAMSLNNAFKNTVAPFVFYS